MTFRPIPLAMAIALCLGAAVSCGEKDAGSSTDAGVTVDAGEMDAGVMGDAGETDAGHDAGPTDAGLGDAGPTDAGPIDAGPRDAGPPDAGEGLDGGGECSSASGAACNTVTQWGDPVRQEQVAAEPPTPAGGTLVPGTYTLATDTAYTGLGGATGPRGSARQQTLVITASSTGFDVQLIDSRPGCADQTQTVSLSMSGTNVTVTSICPTGCSDCGGTQPYSATPTSFSIFEERDGETHVMVFTKL